MYNTKDDISENIKGRTYVRAVRDEIASFIFYAAGCMFGRYSFDIDELVYTGGDWVESK